MLKQVEKTDKASGLDRIAWHKPLVSVIITHFNYSDHIENAILSVLDQSYDNWECVVVDDCSSQDHVNGLTSILERIGGSRIRLIRLHENGGQIPSFFAGLDATSGEFVCLLDPDDRYAETFLQDALACHLNSAVYCPIVCTEQMLLAETGVMTGVLNWYNRANLEAGPGGSRVVGRVEPQLLYFEPHKRGWFWTSSSSMMFRRSACELLRPHKTLAYKGAFDAYMANGAHRLGGTLTFTKPLVYRGLHDGNAWITQQVYSTAQTKQRGDATQWGPQCIVDVTEAIEANGGVIIKPKHRRRRSVLAKWRRSVAKRLNRDANY